MGLEHTYSFTAVFEDGSVIQAIHTDSKGFDCQSRTDGTGSRFTDVQQREKYTKLVSFVLHNDSFSFGVDLVDGHFELNGVPFWLHKPDREPYKDFRVIYFRTCQQTLVPATGQQRAEALSYTVGWQVTHEGNNVKKELTFQA